MALHREHRDNWKLLILGITMGLSACSADAITSIESLKVELQTPGAAISATANSETALVFDDVLNRILPGLADAEAAKEMRLAILAVEKAQLAGDANGVCSSVNKLNRLINELDAHPANMGSIRNAVLRAAARVQPSGVN